MSSVVKEFQALKEKFKSEDFECTREGRQRLTPRLRARATKARASRAGGGPAPDASAPRLTVSWDREEPGAAGGQDVQ